MHLDLKNKMQSELVRNSARLLSANIIAQVVGLLVYPILTRLYTPSDFGVLGLFVSIAGTLAMVGTANYQNAITLPKQEKLAVGAFHTGLSVLVCLSVLVSLTLPFSHAIANLFEAPQLAKWYWLVPLYMLALGCWSLLNNWYIRTKCFSSTARYQINLTLTGTGAKLGFGYACPSAGGLIGAGVISAWLALLASVFCNWRKSLNRLAHFDRQVCHEAARTYRNFPLYALPQSLVNQVSGQLPVWLLIPVFGEAQIGLWNMALLLSFTPLSLINRAVSQVFYQHFSDHVNRRQSLMQLYKRFVWSALGVIVPFFIGLWFVLPAMTEWFLGHEWREAGEYIRWMLPWLGAAMIVSCVGFVPDLFFRQRTSLGLEILQLVLRGSAIVAAIMMHSFMVGVAGIAMASCVVCVVQIFWYSSLLRRYERSLTQEPSE